MHAALFLDGGDMAEADSNEDGVTTSHDVLVGRWLDLENVQNVTGLRSSTLTQQQIKIAP